MATRRFLSINEVIQLAKHNSVINAHLERPKLKNATYASPHVQNEIINIGKNIIEKYLVDKIRSGNHFLIMVDEITSFNKVVMIYVFGLQTMTSERIFFFLQYAKFTRVNG